MRGLLYDLWNETWTAGKLRYICDMRYEQWEDYSMIYEMRFDNK